MFPLALLEMMVHLTRTLKEHLNRSPFTDLTAFKLHILYTIAKKMQLLLLHKLNNISKGLFKLGS